MDRTEKFVCEACDDEVIMACNAQGMILEDAIRYVRVKKRGRL